jgi:hypothetical protein
MKHLAQHVVLAFAFGLLYFLSLLIQKEWVGSALYVGAISLFYLPAGVKLMAIMLGGWVGLAGVAVVALFYTSNLWPEPNWLPPVFTAVWAGVPFLSYHLCLRLMRLNVNLHGLNGMHVLAIALVVSYACSFASQGLLYASGVDGREWLTSNVLAMGFGDFTGITALMLLLLLIKRRMHPQAALGSANTDG